VVVSAPKQGLALYQNPGAAGDPFTDRTEAAGLTSADNGEGRTGYFEVCDWDLDGRSDLIYAAGPGLLLWQNDDGEFEPAEMAGAGVVLDGGTAAFGTITRPDQPSVYFVAGKRKNLLTEDESAVPTAVSTQTSFRLSSPRLGGDILVSTSVSLQSSGDGFPISGEFRVEAADNAAIVVVAIDGTMVRLQIDLNGDGDPDETRDLTWDQLIAAADSAS